MPTLRFAAGGHAGAPLHASFQDFFLISLFLLLASDFRRSVNLRIRRDFQVAQIPFRNIL